MRREDADGGLGRAKEEDRAPQVGADKAEGGASELDCQEVVAVDASTNAGITVEAGPVRTEEVLMTDVIVPRLATDEVVAVEVATAEASSGPASQEDPREVAGEAVKGASTGMRTLEPPETVAQASSGPRPALGMRADMPAPGTEIGVAAGPPLFGAASGSERASQGAHTAQTMESDRSEASTTPRAAAKGASGGGGGGPTRLRPGLVVAAKVPPANSKRNGWILIPAPGLVEAAKPRAIT
jgi:hypothetical protein